MNRQNMHAHGMADLVQLTRPRFSGRPVNSHVVYAPKEPAADFQRIRNLTSEQKSVDEDKHSESTQPDT